MSVNGRFGSADMLWDGKEDLEVGMLVQDEQKSEDVVSTVLFIKGGKVCLESKLDLSVTYLENISSLVKCPKEEFCKEVLNTIRSSYPIFSQGSTWYIEDVASVCWDKLRGGEDE